MRIEDEIFKRTGLRLRDLRGKSDLANDIDMAHASDALMRVQDVAQILHGLAHARNKAAPEPEKPKFNVCWNFLTRSTHMSLAAMALLHEHDLPDVAVMNRSILERALFLSWLRETNGFEKFRRFTILKEFEHQEMWIRHHPGQGKGFISKEKRAEAMAFKEELAKEKWGRPDLENVAKQANVQRLYDGIYHFSSGYVHPLYGEGEMIFAAVVGKPLAGYSESKLIIFRHTATALAMLCIEVARILGTPTQLGTDLLSAMQSELTQGPNDSFDGLIELAKAAAPEDLFIPN